MGIEASLVIFAYESLLPRTFACIIRDAREWPDLHIAHAGGDALIDRTRSNAATDFLDTPGRGDVLMMIDHDISWQPGDLQRLAESTQKTEGVVAGVYPKRVFGEGVAVRLAESGEYTLGTDMIVPAALVSTGFIGIHRKVLEKLASTHDRTLGNFYPFFMPALMAREDGPAEYLSEDWAFCRRAQEAGFPILVDLKPRLQHTGYWTYRVADSQLTMGPDVPVTLQVKGNSDIRALDTLMRDIADHTKIPRDSIRSACRDATTMLSALWLKKPEGQSDIDWYKKDDVGMAYTLDLAMWHTSKMIPLFEDLHKIEGGRALDFGAGIGTMSLVLASKNEVDAIEVNSVMKEFTQVRAEKLGVTVNHVEEPEGEYDTILAWDVLEHLENPEEVAKMLASHLAPKGVLFQDTDFVADALHPMHHEWEIPSGEKVKEIWEGVGLKHIGNYRWVR